MSRDIDFAEFCKIMLPVLNGKFEEDELFYAFKKFDLDGSGYISSKELRQILSKIGQIYSESQILELISTVAANPSRGLTFPGINISRKKRLKLGLLLYRYFLVE